ncbi:MAG: ECF transporter S component [Vallitaleaceae bacterium]|nr:ECF transporter S component [Vallitaleaceae bacterium]
MKEAVFNQKQSIMKTKWLVRVGVLGSLSFVVMLLEFYIGFAEFLKLDFSDIIVMIGGITMGPLAAAAIQLIKNLLKVVIITRTAGIGELANLIVGLAFVLPAVTIYHHKKSTRTLLIGLVVGILSMVTIGALANYFVLLPFWGIKDAAGRIALLTSALIPFNFIKGIVITILTLVVHTGLKPVYRYLALK